MSNSVILSPAESGHRQRANFVYSWQCELLAEGKIESLVKLTSLYSMSTSELASYEEQLGIASLVDRKEDHL